MGYEYHDNERSVLLYADQMKYHLLIGSVTKISIRPQTLFDQIKNLC